MIGTTRKRLFIRQLSYIHPSAIACGMPGTWKSRHPISCRFVRSTLPLEHMVFLIPLQFSKTSKTQSSHTLRP
ncbi:hypothetical protein SODALDRAFT_59417 [Sodiomyces alkalinus F11]|uniref:Uncharacterized protein n=1 Tax=Sodiomyces alkalinus (strain CBS 110278 / VKM F-3762 / F11) TaxID=1314773 RepID=A0A3N2PNV8_SODAK|nr:hypothetical protein SODALDRAFT_59417 [Sodiomyces alkalinus F11]ROT36192.1 hypothetical protein SODALDRAFT_59417 [Sodiomyces alkalinus F11]